MQWMRGRKGGEVSSRVGSNLVEVKLNWWESSIVVEYVCGCGVETTSDLSSGELLHFSQLAGDSNRSTLTFPVALGRIGWYQTMRPYSILG